MPAFKDIGSADQSKITHNRGQTFFKPKNALKWLLLPVFLNECSKKICHKKIQHISGAQVFLSEFFNAQGSKKT